MSQNGSSTSKNESLMQADVTHIQEGEEKKDGCKTWIQGQAVHQ